MTAPRALVVDGGIACRGTVRTPGEKSISHRAVLFGALAEGTSIIHGLSDGADVAASLAAVEAMGADVERHDDGTIVVRGGRGRLHQPAAPLDCGNSGTSMRLLTGLVAGFDWETELVGDESLSSRPMDRVAEPLDLMGATVTGQGRRCEPPLRVVGGALHGIDWTSKVASAQVKSAILLAGLSASGTTVVREEVTTRTHTEEMLREAGADITVEPWGEGRVVRVRPSSLQPVERTRARRPFGIGLLRGGRVRRAREHGGRGGGLPRPGPAGVCLGPPADGRTHHAPPRRARHHHHPGDVGPAARHRGAGSEIPSLDEIPVLAIAAAVAEGTTVFSDVGELRVKEVDRLLAVADMVEAFGARATIDGDSLSVTGLGGPLLGGRFDSRGDHRMAMAAAVAALAARAGERSLLTGFGAVATSYPTFAQDLARLAAGSSAPRPLLVAIDGPAGAGKSTVSSAVAQRLGRRTARHRRHVPRGRRTRPAHGDGAGGPRCRRRPGGRIDD